jgi:hypothetical protein
VPVDEAFAGFAECTVGIGNVAGRMNTDPPDPPGGYREMRAAGQPDREIPLCDLRSHSARRQHQDLTENACACVPCFTSFLKKLRHLDARGEYQLGKRE